MKRLRLVNVTVVMTKARGVNEFPCGRYVVDFSRSVGIVRHVKRFLRLLIGARWNLREHFRNARDFGMIRSLRDLPLSQNAVGMERARW